MGLIRPSRANWEYGWPADVWFADHDPASCGVCRARCRIVDNRQTRRGRDGGGARRAPIERTQPKAFDRFVKACVVGGHQPESNMFSDLPPGSGVAGCRISGAYGMISRPVWVEPVNAILASRLDRVRGANRAPVTMDNIQNPRRRQIADDRGQRHDRADAMIAAGARAAGFSTTQWPAAKAGARFKAAVRIEKVHNIIWPTTPSGS